MRSAREIIWIICLLLFGFSIPNAYSEIIFDDGNVHVIDYVISEEVWLRDNATGQTTTLNIATGGQINNVNLEGHSVANIMGGTVVDTLYGGWWDDSQINVFDGYVNFLVQTQGHSVNIYGGFIRELDVGLGLSNVNISGGTIERIDNAGISGGNGYREVIISGGEILSILPLYNNISVYISGGTFNPRPGWGAIDLSDNSSAIISGGIFNSFLMAIGNSVLTLVGNDFTIDGQPVPYGEYTLDCEVTLTGLLANGEAFNNLIILDSSTLILEPTTEPTTPPVADADGPYTVFVGDILTLDASDSTDDDNDIVSYMWDLDDNNSFETDAGGQAIFDVNYAYLQSLGLLVNHTYNIHLRVTDSEGQSDTNDSMLTIVPKPALVVAVDIKPGGCPNPLNVKSSGVLPVAILGSGDLDVSQIVPTSVRLAGVEAIRNSYEDVAAPVTDTNDCNCTAQGPDGYPDLTLKFKTQEIVEAIGDVNEGDVLTLELTGVLFGERPIEGADCVVIRGRHKPLNSADINKDGVVNGIDFAVIAENWLNGL